MAGFGRFDVYCNLGTISVLLHELRGCLDSLEATAVEHPRGCGTLGPPRRTIKGLSCKPLGASLQDVRTRRSKLVRFSIWHFGGFAASTVCLLFSYSSNLDQDQDILGLAYEVWES